MTITKQISKEGRCELTITDEIGKAFKIHMGGADLYWSMIDYEEGNVFLVNEGSEFYEQMDILFEKITKYDNPYDKTLNGNVFRWLSEARLPEESSELEIKKMEDSYQIIFLRNPDDIFGQFANTCCICFCLSGSRNQEIAYSFNYMYVNYEPKSEQGKRKLKQMNV